MLIIRKRVVYFKSRVIIDDRLENGKPQTCREAVIWLFIEPIKDFIAVQSGTCSGIWENNLIRRDFNADFSIWRAVFHGILEEIRQNNVKKITIKLYLKDFFFLNIELNFFLLD